MEVRSKDPKMTMRMKEEGGGGVSEKEDRDMMRLAGWRC